MHPGLDLSRILMKSWSGYRSGYFLQFTFTNKNNYLDLLLSHRSPSSPYLSIEGSKSRKRVLLFGFLQTEVKSTLYFRTTNAKWSALLIVEVRGFLLPCYVARQRNLLWPELQGEVSRCTWCLAGPIEPFFTEILPAPHSPPRAWPVGEHGFWTYWWDTQILSCWKCCSFSLVFFKHS